MRLSTLIARVEDRIASETPKLKTRALRATHYVVRKAHDGIERLEHRVQDARVQHEGLDAYIDPAVEANTFHPNPEVQG